MKCINCGVEVTGNVCEYCGTHYNNNGFCVKFAGPGSRGTLKVGDKEYKVYIDEVRGEMTSDFFIGRDINGHLIRMPSRMIHTFILKEI